MSKAKPVRWTIRQVKFLNGEGGCMTRLELLCLGGWTYHQCFKGDPFFHRFDSSTWSVTHLATSRSVAYCISQSDARKCVTYLANNWPWQHRDLPQNKELAQSILLGLKAARERGELLFYLGRETEKPWSGFRKTSGKESWSLLSDKAPGVRTAVCVGC